MGGRIISPICPFFKTAKLLELEEKRRTLREELKGARVYE